LERFNIEAKHTVLSYKKLVKIEAKTNWFSLQFCEDKSKRNVFLTLSTTKRKRPGCSKFLEEKSEAFKDEDKKNWCIPKICINKTERSETF